MGNKIEPGINPPTVENHEGVSIPPFAQNITEIGRVASRFGETPPGYGNTPVKFLASCENESMGFRAEVYLLENDPYIVLVKRGAARPGILLPNYDHLKINYRLSTQTYLKVNKSEYPESQEFEKPDDLPAGNIFIAHGQSISFWMPSALLGPKTLDFLNRITGEALKEFVVLDENEQDMEPKEFEPK